MDMREARKWCRALRGKNETDIINFITCVFGPEDGVLMHEIIREEKLIETEKLKRNLSEENKIDINELGQDGEERKNFVIKEEDEIWK